MTKIKFFYGLFFVLGFVIATEYGVEINKEVSKKAKSFKYFIKDQNLMKRAEKMKETVKKGGTRFSQYFNKKAVSLKRSLASQKTPKTFYAYGTDHYDPSLNARCTLLDYKKVNGKIITRMNCSGKKELQKKVAMDIKQKVRNGEL